LPNSRKRKEPDCGDLDLSKNKLSSLLNKIIAYEAGELDPEETLEFFAELIKSGMAFNRSLQGSYGRRATEYINAGYIDRRGNVLRTWGEPEEA
jgi:hypothetical protein